MASDHDPVPQPTWSPEVRTWVSLLLFVHLFAVVVAVTSYTRPSTVQDQLHALFAPYLRALHLAVFPNTYPFARFHLTHAGTSDVDFACEIDVKDPQGSVETIVLPEPGLWGVRQRRYQSLVNAMGTLAGEDGNEELAAILPKAVAGSVLKRAGAAQGTIRCLAHFLPAADQIGTPEATRPNGVVYEAQVFSSGGSVELLKKATKLEVAPRENAPQK